MSTRERTTPTARAARPGRPRRLGLFGLTAPEAYGGGEGDLVALCVAIEELGRVDQSIGITLEAAVGLGVFDHLGQISLDGGMSNPQLVALLRLLKEDHCWVKLCGYRVSKNGPPYDDIRAPVEAMIAAAPTRCVWGTDWPHPHLEGRPYPDVRFLLDLVGDWAGDEAQRKTA